MSAAAPLTVSASTPTLSADELLARFLAYVSSTGVTLYPAQEEAILEIISDHNVILNTPTGSGKSLVANAMHFKALAEGKRSFYTSPIKALASEKFFALCELFGSENVGMMTGDASINRDAPIVCCTAEILAGIAVREGNRSNVAYAVLDEFHYYADRERGSAWELPLLAMPGTTFLLMSATMGNAEWFASWLTERTGRETALVRSNDRPVPLDYEYRETPLHETIEDLLARHREPIYLVNFTQRSAADEAQNLTSVNLCTRDEKQQINADLASERFDSPYGKEVLKLLRHGIGLHHAGLLPRYRRTVEKLAQKGRLKVISGTDTLGVGINVPIRTVLFSKLCKYDGEKTTLLSVRDFKQIAGRAGRKGFDDRGTVVAQAPEHVVENRKIEAKIAGDPAKARKAVFRKPPEKGYVHFDHETFERLVARGAEALQSRFRVDHGMLVASLQGHSDRLGGGYRALLDLVTRSHLDDHNKRIQSLRARDLFRALRHAGVIRVVPRVDGRGSDAVVDSDLQREFSLHHALGLFLLETVPLLDPNAPGYALDVVTLAESIVENPEVVLAKQLDQLKTEKLAELKADGVEYEQRMEELTKLEHPKPLREFLYTAFNEFAAKHPWLGEENVKPKSIVREMVEGFASFDDYVVTYGLQRSEGVLLRYLSDVYKVLVQNVPEAARTPDVWDVIAFVRAVIGRVDSSLVDEWERMQRGEVAGASVEPAERAVATVLGPGDPRVMAARVREELHAFVRAIAAKAYGEAIAAVAVDERDPWSAERLAAAMGAYWPEYEAIRVDRHAREPRFTTFEPRGNGVYRVRQTLVDPAGDLAWFVEGTVDRARAMDPDARLFVLETVGA